MKRNGNTISFPEAGGLWAYIDKGKWYNFYDKDSQFVGAVNDEGRVFAKGYDKDMARETGNIFPVKRKGQLLTKGLIQAARCIFLHSQVPIQISANSETRVKAKYPNAKCERDGAMFFVRSGKKDLGAGFSKEGAWCSAGCSVPSKKQKQ